MRVESTRPLRCATYTRKSTKHGLEQAFNSLRAQREACEAYKAGPPIQLIGEPLQER